MLRDARQHLPLICLAVLLFATGAPAQQTATQVSLRQVVPVEAHAGMVYTRNPEREGQHQQFQDVVRILKEERLLERIDRIIRSRTPQDKQEEAAQGFAQLTEALEPASLEALLNAEEFALAEVSQDKSGQVLLVVRMTPDAAQGWFEAVRNLGSMAKDLSGVDFKLNEQQVDGATYFTMDAPGNAAMNPTAAVAHDVLVLSTSQSLARNAVQMLHAESPKSKFDEPRVAQALAALPEGEDLVQFRDGRIEFGQLRKGYLPYRKEFQKHADDDPQIAEGMRLMESLLNESEVLDLEVGVEYTEEGKNHYESITSLLPGAHEKLGGKLLLGGEPIRDWEKWVPTSAVGYSVSSGVDLHGCYRLIMGVLSSDAPRIQGKLLSKLREYEAKYQVELEKDLLEVFSGQSVSITLPGNQSVWAVKCAKPERAMFLFHSLLDRVSALPQMALLQPQLIRSKSLEGFEEVVSPMLQANGVQPAVGFKEGWMIVASSALAAEDVIDSRWNDSPNIGSTQGFKRFGIDADGAVLNATYSNSREKIRGLAMQIESFGMLGPMMLGMAAPNIKPRDMATIQEVCALAPSVARLIRSFDFLDSYLSISRPGQTGDSYRKHSVMIVRPPVAQ